MVRLVKDASAKRLLTHGDQSRTLSYELDNRGNFWTTALAYEFRTRGPVHAHSSSSNVNNNGLPGKRRRVVASPNTRPNNSTESNHLRLSESIVSLFNDCSRSYDQEAASVPLNSHVGKRTHPRCTSALAGFYQERQVDDHFICGDRNELIEADSTTGPSHGSPEGADRSLAQYHAQDQHRSQDHRNQYQLPERDVHLSRDPRPIKPRNRRAMHRSCACCGSRDSDAKSGASGASSRPISVSPCPPLDVYDVLNSILESEGRQLDTVQGDGNCFFRALSKELYKTEGCHDQLRQAIVDMIEKYPVEFDQFLDAGETLHDHIVSMRRHSEWATTMEIYAAATLMQRDVFIFSPDYKGDNYRWLLFTPLIPQNPNPSLAHSCHVSLCHTNGNHYDRIAPVDSAQLCNCSLRRPVLSGMLDDVDLTLR